MAAANFEKETTFSTFQELFELDERFRKALHAGLQKFLWNGTATKNHPNAKKNIQLAGSAIEGATLARVFQKNDEFPSGLNQEIEVDIEYCLFQIPEDKKHLVKEIDSEQGFVQIEFTKDLINDSISIGWNVDKEDFEEYYGELISLGGFLKPFRAKQIAQQKVAFQDVDNEYPLLFGAMFGVPKCDIKVENLACEVTKSSVASEILVKVKEEPKLKISFDTVIIVKLAWQSQIAKDWLRRPKNWPSYAICEQLMKSGSYVIPKPSKKNKLHLDTTEMRYAFSQTERELVKLRSQNQNFVYMVFKIMFVKWIKPIDTEEISSFIAKTAMFWIAEEFPPGDSVWDVFDEDSLLLPLQILFSWLLSTFESGFVPYYFNVKINIIAGVSGMTKELVITKMEEILNDMRQFLLSDMHQELELCKDVTIKVDNFGQIFTMIKNKDYIGLLQHLPPELCLDALKHYNEHPRKYERYTAATEENDKENFDENVNVVVENENCSLTQEIENEV
eukprot:TCONS_00067991-protein